MAEVVRRREPVVDLIRLRAGRETEGALVLLADLSSVLSLVGVLAEVLSLVGVLGAGLVGRLLVGRLVGMSLVGLLITMSLGDLLIEAFVPGLVAGAHILAPLGARRALSMALLLFRMDVTSLPVRPMEPLLGPTIQRSRFPVEQYRESPLLALAMAQSRTL